MIPFHETIQDVYDYLNESGYPRTIVMNTCDSMSTSLIVPSSNYASKDRRRCDYCDKFHDEDNCHLRGFTFMPPSLAKKIQRYNELHGHKPKVPKQEALQKPFEPKHNKIKPSAAMGSTTDETSISLPIDDPPPIASPSTPDESSPTEENPDLLHPPRIDHTNHSIQPSTGMAEFANIDSDYMNFLFPSGNMTSIDLVSLAANMAAQDNPKNPLVHKNSTAAEQDELFSHNIVMNHRGLFREFHADWGSNVIIVNNKELFLEFTECNDSLNPIHGIPANGIKGYGTIIFLFGNQLVPIREVAYMPGNPHCTFTSSHLQRMNVFLPGVHSMHASVKVLNREGQSTKWIPKIRNGLDYINVAIALPPKNDNTPLTPQACMAKTLSPQLEHQKCGLFVHGRIEKLAKQKLVDGIPVKTPSLDHKCQVCMQTKSTHHPRKPPTDYTMLKKGQQLHIDWCFIGETSIRGHTSILRIKCANTHKCWSFPCTTKRSPIDLIRFFIKYLEKEDIVIVQIRVDEGGSLANSTGFCKLLFTHGITLQTTGGYSSDLNGNVEVLNKVLKQGTGAILANSGLSLPYWCYATVHFCCILNFLSYNHSKTMTAYQAWFNKKPHWNDFRIFGGDIYVVEETTSKNNLQKASKHKFLGWGTSTASVHYLENTTNKFREHDTFISTIFPLPHPIPN